MKLVTLVHFKHILYQASPAENKVLVTPVSPLLLLAIFALCVITSFVLCYVAKALFPKFRSGEHKPGTHRLDLPAAGGREVKTIELPLVGGPAFMLAVLGIGVLTGFFLKFDRDQWTFLLIGLFAGIGYATVGFIDDWNKVHSNEGLTEFKKFTGVFLVGCIAAVLYFFLLPSLGQESYAFYKDLPILNTLLCGKITTKDICDVSNATVYPVAHYSWLIFLMLLTGAVGSFTSLSVDFSDGLDGLAGGLVFSAALAMAIIVAGLVGKLQTGVVLEVLSLLAAGGILGYLPLNWPSAWAARRGKATRRAKIYMGDCGALGMGGLLAMIAIFSRNELLLIMIGGAFVLEGLSVLVSARIMTRFFRRHLQILRFASTYRVSAPFFGNPASSSLRSPRMGSPPPGLWFLGTGCRFCGPRCNGRSGSLHLATLRCTFPHLYPWSSRLVKWFVVQMLLRWEIPGRTTTQTQVGTLLWLSIPHYGHPPLSSGRSHRGQRRCD